MARFSDIRAFPLPSPTVPQSGDVSSLAIKCLPPLVKGASERAAGEVIDALCAKLVAAGKDHRAHRDAGVIGLKSVVADLGAHPAAPRVISALVPKLVAHVRAAVDSGDAAKNTGAAGDVSGDCLDVLHAAVSSGGAALAAVADDRIVSPLLAYLAESGRHGARKRAVACLAALAANVSDATLASIADAASSKLAPLADAGASQTASARDDASLYANLLGACAKSAGRRFGRHADAAMPSLLALCASAEEEGCETLREECLRAMELFAATCADDAGVSRRLPDAVDLALRLCSFDPNYDDDEEEEEGDANGGEEMDADDDDGYSDDDEGYSDVDDDSSWKVRRGAARVLAAVAAASPTTLEARFEPTVAKLLARLGEREESVKLDVFAALEETFRATSPARGAADSLVAAAKAAVPRATNAATRRFRERGATQKTKTAAFSLLREIAASLPGAFVSDDGDDAALVAAAAAAAAALEGSGSGSGSTNGPSNVGFGSTVAGAGDVRVEALVFARLAFASHPPSACASFAKTLAPAMCSATSDRYYKVAAEALRACEAATGAVHEVARATKDASTASRLFDAALERVAAADQDQEVKEAAISCAAAAAATLGDVLSPDAISRAATALLERTRNDATRVAATKALGDVARSRLGVNLSDVVTDAARAFASFLRKNDRTLRHASLDTMCALFTGENARHIADDVAGVAVAEAARLVSDADVALASVSLTLTSRAIRGAVAFPTAVAAARDETFPAAIALARSPLTRGRASAPLRLFFAAVVASGARTGEETRAALMDAAIASADAGTTDAGSALASSSATAKVLGECVAAVCAVEDAAGENVSTRVAETLASVARGEDARRAIVAFRALGELARVAARAFDDATATALEASVRAAFDAEGEEVRSAAAFALGGAAAGTSRARFLPAVVDGVVGGDEKRRYAFLLAAREMIEAVGVGAGVGGGASDAGDAGDAHASERNVSAFSAEEAKTVADALLSRASHEEEATRNVVAECLGRLAARYPTGGLVARLAELADPTVDAGKDPNARITAVTAAKYLATTLARGDDASAAEASAALASFAGEQSLRDADRGVRRAAAQTLSAAAHARPASVLPILPDVLPILLESAAVDESLVRVVDLGPFKVTVDDGLDARRAAFECVDTLLDGCLRPDAPGNPLERLDVAPGIVAALVGGVGDHYDVKMIAHSALAKLSKSRAGAAAVLDAVEALLAPMRKTLTAKLKSDAVKQEIDRNEDLVRSCLRAAAALATTVEGAATHPAFVAFAECAESTGKTAPAFAAAMAEAKGDEGKKRETRRGDETR